MPDPDAGVGLAGKADAADPAGGFRGCCNRLGRSDGGWACAIDQHVADAGLAHFANNLSR